MTKNWRAILALAIILIYGSYVCFVNLNDLPIGNWDEATNGCNTFEMDNRGDFLVKYLNGKEDLWNTKPPLINWMQVACLKVWGDQEIAIRFPTAFFGLMNALLLFFFFHRYRDETLVGFLAAGVLLSIQGYVTLHGTRSGDYDVVVTFFMISGTLLAWLYAESQKGKYLAWIGVIVGIGILVKGVQILIFGPFWAVLILLSVNIKTLFTTRWLWISLGIVLVIAGSFYVLREMQTPGFFKAMWANEVGGRYNTVIEQHEESFWYYFDKQWNVRFQPWVLFLLPTLILALVRTRTRKLAIYLFITSLGYSLIIANAQTKLIWYFIPNYPLLSMVIALGLANIFYFAADKWPTKKRTIEIGFALIIALIYYEPARIVISKVSTPQDFDPAITQAYFLRDIANDHTDYSPLYIHQPIWYPSSQFYALIMERKGMEVEVSWQKKWSEPGDYGFLSQGAFQADTGLHHHTIVKEDEHYVLIRLD